MMDEAQLQGVEDAAKTRDNVNLLLERRYVPRGWEGGAASHSQSWWETAGLLSSDIAGRNQRFWRGG